MSNYLVYVRYIKNETLSSKLEDYIAYLYKCTKSLEVNTHITSNKSYLKKSMQHDEVKYFFKYNFFK